MMRPHLVRRVDNLRTGEQRAIAPAPLRRIPHKPEHLAFVVRAMAGVITEGTGARAFAGAPYTSAGKTGTAQVVGIKQNEKYDERKVAERHRDHSLFIVFAPVEAPRIALAVLVENGGFGARAAAPIARAVLDYHLLGKLPPALEQPAPVDETDAEEGD